MHKTSTFGKTFHKEAVFYGKRYFETGDCCPSPDKELFDQAIFILKDEAVSQGITEELLLKEAKKTIGASGKKRYL